MTAQESAKHESIINDIKAHCGDAVVGVEREHGDLVLVVQKSALVDALRQLRDHHGMDLLLDIAGVDCLEMEEYRERFELEYMLYATGDHCRVRVRTHVPETDMDVDTASVLWQSANWAEREAFEMFGFNFVGHSCLRRLLTHDEFDGHPLRKDYPIMGGQWCSTTSDLTEQLNEDQGGVPE